MDRSKTLLLAQRRLDVGSVRSKIIGIHAYMSAMHAWGEIDGKSENFFNLLGSK
jgi:hypothetical protein